MKLVVATGIFPPDIGGPATYVAGLVPELVEKGWNVEVVTYGDENASLEGPTYPVARVSRSYGLPWRYLSFFNATRKALRKADLAFLQDPLSAGLPASLAALTRKTPIVLKIVGDLAWEIGRERGIVVDGIDAFQSNRYRGLVERMRSAQRFVARRAERIITPSRYLKDLVCGWGVEADRIAVIENGARPKRESTIARDRARELLEIEGDPIVTTAGRLVPWKGFETLIDSMPAILERYRKARLVIVGTGPLQSSLRERIESIGLAHAVQLVGACTPSEMALHLRASDVFVLVSSYEGFSHLLLEAMQSEIPIVASKAGGNPELVIDGESGLLVAPVREDVERAVVGILGDASLRQRLAANARERAADFTWQKTVSRTIQLLQEVAGRS